MDFLRGPKFPYSVCGVRYGVHDGRKRFGDNLTDRIQYFNILQYLAYAGFWERKIKCNDRGKRTVVLP